MKSARLGNIVVSFNESNHTYTDNLGRKYISVTTLINSQFQKFDTEAHAVRVAIREGVSKEEVIARWKQKGEETRDLGTRAHKLAESIFLRTPLPVPDSDQERRLFAMIWDACSKLRDMWVFHEAEMIVFDPEYLIAGQIDLMMIEPGNTEKIGINWITDWKTCESLTDDSYGKFGLPPISHYRDSKISKYTLQVRIYEWMFRKMCGHPLTSQGMTDCGIIHVHHSLSAPRWISVERVDREIELIMQHRKQQIGGQTWAS